MMLLGGTMLMGPRFAGAPDDADISRLIVYLRCTQTGLPHCLPTGAADMVSFHLNGRTAIVSTQPDTPMLWAIRDLIGLKWCSGVR
ncbi:hypothetical protein CHU95_03855 [Niveispirillum lacus]|uniref:Uncharacterized protein n=1 Tax=Niveispirillum lacus TaxID=1981099 RepID=A0A255Z596_9PROT|nr:hypothetical protein [Niveispirillum lacus]OYQ36703.1 hypothetical protein CHU95_03855 [Niveispirillum lacus]